MTEQGTDIKITDSIEQRIIDSIPTGPKLSKFRTADGPFGWFAHGVTGEEMNRFIVSVQQHLAVEKESIGDLYERMKQLIERFEELDEFTVKQLEPLLESVNESIKTANEAKEGLNQLNSSIENLTAKINDMDNMAGKIDDMNKTKEDCGKLRKKISLSYWIIGCSFIVSAASIILHFVH